MIENTARLIINHADPEKRMEVIITNAGNMSRDGNLIFTLLDLERNLREAGYSMELVGGAKDD